MVNPFDPRTVLLAKHAQHVVLIHFPIALFTSGVAFDLISRGRRTSLWASAAYLNLTAAAITVFPTVGTGLLAWQFGLAGKRLTGLLLLHLVAGGCTAFLLVVTWILHWRVRRCEKRILLRYRISVELLGVGVIALTAHLGGFLSGVNS
jgi:uncharacterized membrane protein